MNKGDHQTRRRLARKKKVQIKRPSAPHNTNQFLIDANNACEETTNLYGEQDRITYDFQNHSMAGSMMGKFFPFSNFDDTSSDFMARFSRLRGQSTEASDNSDKGFSLPIESVGETRVSLEDERFESMEGIQERSSLIDQEKCQERVSDLVNSNTSRLGNPVNIAVRNEEDNLYGHYLRQGESGEKLQGLVQQLVEVINQKDDEIQALKARLSL